MSVHRQQSAALLRPARRLQESYCLHSEEEEKRGEQEIATASGVVMFNENFDGAPNGVEAVSGEYSIVH